MPNETQNGLPQTDTETTAAASAKFDCPNCGSRVTARRANGTLTCPNCRSKLSAEDAVVPAAQLPEASAQKDTAQSGGRGGIIAGIVIGAVILCCILIAAVIFK